MLAFAVDPPQRQPAPREDAPLPVDVTIPEILIKVDPADDIATAHVRKGRGMQTRTDPRPWEWACRRISTGEVRSGVLYTLIRCTRVPRTKASPVQ